MNNNSNQENSSNKSAKAIDDYRVLYHEILNYANEVLPRIEFLNKVLKKLLEFSECDILELWLKKPEKFVKCEISRKDQHSFIYKLFPLKRMSDGSLIPNQKEISLIDHIRAKVLARDTNYDISSMTTYGSFWNGDIPTLVTGLSKSQDTELAKYVNSKINYKSLVMIPLLLGDDIIGLLQIASFKKDHCSQESVKLFEDIAGIIAVALVNQRSQAALHERVKELTCLYSIARLVGKGEMSLSEIIQSIADLIPTAWQYPEITASKIILDERSFATAGFREDCQKQTAEITVAGNRRGCIEVIYTKLKPEMDEGPFLKEERSLIEVISQQIALIIERRETKEKSDELQEQLRHADRLATIGQLAAGVAHELNEPLGGVLGFAQLIKKNPDATDTIIDDIDKIVRASLHAREVIKKLMFFAKQMPPGIKRVQLNEIVKEGLYFYEARCAKAGIELHKELSEDLPKVMGDYSQLNQVLINLVVNSIQAMPAGGKLAIHTHYDNSYVYLEVEDNGIGMSADIKQKAFIPFFTTKEIDEGTGLGLAVVHGIVTAHKGKIEIFSEVGKGSRFKVKLPIE